jgi:hypothetical protein
MTDGVKQVDPLRTAILEVVTGDRHWRDLREVGVSIALSKNRVAILGQPDAPVQVGLLHVAKGWLRHSSNDAALREWARLVHGGVSLVDLDLGESRAADTMRDLLWRVAFGEPITPEMHDAARECASKDGE